MTHRSARILPPEGFQSRGTGPLYLRLRQFLEEAILSGKLNHGDALIPERDLASYAGVSRVTVRKAVESLVDEGLLVRRRGAGTFVECVRSNVGDLLRRSAQLVDASPRQCANSRVQWLERGLFQPTSEEIITLGLSAHCRVARLTCLHLSNDEPLAVERSSVSADVIPEPLRVNSSIHDWLRGINERPIRAIQRLTVRTIKKPDAYWLGLIPPAAGLSVERVSYLSSGRAIAFTRSVFRGDGDGFVSEFEFSES
ncbi:MULTISPECIES: GntR family transcriptional regulator [Rhizobium]|uniref:GntR family transcriptional regulator n=1 Tax=Rhizobium TaxID=379 RepID=UPI001C82A2DA|nr:MULTISPECIES: GntR family transcriptional regulator [Rhizobium]MBX4870279.1 GntR family transcriptional regulator [Rhizobium bangladeshense]MBX5213748.1 GntR family transcriptional regulator [Rhizobium sp. NLR9a]MBX5219101.1 GntR family transcriptional regulator [Rhizobium sp. NLR8a]MBX5232965.1 GntR family transcriptional regulator [Rhizobium sp. NLR4a]MBX5246088.1 GntR family transcriptional regulator [Rhizobium sp. NLR3b]